MVVQEKQELYKGNPTLENNNNNTILMLLDLDSTYIACCKNFVNYSGHSSSEELQGLSAWDLKNHSLQSQAGRFTEQDQRVINMKIPEYNIEYFYKDNKVVFVSVEKKPILLPNNEVIGISCKSYVISRNFCQKTYKGFNAKIPTIQNMTVSNYPPFDLTMRESHCLYHVIRGKYNNEIGALLRISRRTVDDYIEKLRHKMGCNSKRELIEKSIDLGFHKITPPGILL